MRRGSAPVEMFIDKLFMFNLSLGRHVPKSLPSCGEKPLDLYGLYKAVRSRGGYSEVCKKKMWAHVCKEMYLSTSMKSTIMRHYRKFMTEFEEWDKKNESEGGVPILKQVFMERSEDERMYSIAKNAGVQFFSKTANRAEKWKRGLSDSSSGGRPCSTQSHSPSELKLSSSSSLSSSPSTSPLNLRSSNHTSPVKVNESMARSNGTLSQNGNTPGVIDLTQGVSDEDSQCIAFDDERGEERVEGKGVVIGVKEEDVEEDDEEGEEYIDWRTVGTVPGQGTLYNQKFGYHMGKSYTLDGFEAHAHRMKRELFGLAGGEHARGLEDDPYVSVEELEARYWGAVDKGEEYLQVHYGSDICTQGARTSGFELGVGISDSRLSEALLSPPGWNQHVLPKLAGSMVAHNGEDVPGVSSPFMYIGMVFASFCWHTEDNYLYSINHLHMGAPKRWYGVPSHAADQFERAIRDIVPGLFQDQPELLHLLVTQIPPSYLVSRGVPVYTGLQREGQIVITFPRAYHAGFSHGFNAAESVNLAYPDWIPWLMASSDAYRFAASPHLPVIPCHSFLLDAAEAYKDDNYAMRHILPEVRSLLQEEKALRGGLRDMKIDIAQISPSRQSRPRTSYGSCVVCKLDCYFSYISCKACSDPNSAASRSNKTEGSSSKGRSKHMSCLNHPERLCECPVSEKVLHILLSEEGVDTLLRDVEEHWSRVQHWSPDPLHKQNDGWGTAALYQKWLDKPQINTRGSKWSTARIFSGKMSSQIW